MFKKFMIAAAVTATLGSAGIASADAWHHPGQHGLERAAHAKKWAYAPARDTIVRTELNRRVRNDTLPLFRMTGLHRDYRGYSVEDIIIKVRPHRSHGALRLVVNGRVVDSARVGDDHIVRLDTRRADVIGAEIKSLQLDVDGRVDIRTIDIRLKDRLAHNERGRHDGGWSRVHNMNESTADIIARVILSEFDLSRY